MKHLCFCGLAKRKCSISVVADIWTIEDYLTYLSSLNVVIGAGVISTENPVLPIAEFRHFIIRVAPSERHTLPQQSLAGVTRTGLRYPFRIRHRERVPEGLVFRRPDKNLLSLPLIVLIVAKFERYK